MNKTDGAKKAAPRYLRNDVILIFAVLLVAVVIGLLLALTGKEGDTVTVTVNGAPYGSYSLYENRTVEIVTEAGTNRLVIKNGEAFVEAASCPDGICVAHRPIKSTRESIVCLPHGVVISILRAEDENAPDLVV